MFTGRLDGAVELSASERFRAFERRMRLDRGNTIAVKLDTATSAGECAANERTQSGFRQKWRLKGKLEALIACWQVPALPASLTAKTPNSWVLPDGC